MEFMEKCGTRLAASAGAARLACMTRTRAPWCLPVIVFVLGVTWRPATAEIRSLRFDDPVGDALSVPGMGMGMGMGGDIAQLEVLYSTETGDYQATFIAAPGASFSGVASFSFDLAVESEGIIDSIFGDGSWRNLSVPVERFLLEGNAEVLLDLPVGLKVFAAYCREAESEGDFCETSKLRQLASGLLVDDFAPGTSALIAAAPPVPPPALLRIAFNGVFVHCDNFNGPNTCAAGPFAALADTTFSGEIIFPSSGVDSWPDEPEFGWYEFGGLARMSLNAVGDAYDLTDAAVEVVVRNCRGALFCAPKDDYVWFLASAGNIGFELVLARPRPPFLEDAIPTVPVLASLSPGFYVYTLDYMSFIRTDVFTVPSSISFTISALPSVPSTIPIPSFSSLAAAALAFLLVSIGIAVHSPRVQSRRKS